MHLKRSKRLPGKSSSFDKSGNNPGREAGVFFCQPAILGFAAARREGTVHHEVTAISDRRCP